jgi:polyisoprenoid-binding protein YceI
MTAPRTASRRGLIMAGAAVAVLALVGVGLWSWLSRPSGPAPVSLGSMPPASGTVGGSGGGADGTWTVDGSGAPASGEATFVGYRVREELANIGTTEAVGRTSSVSGSMVIQGTTITKVEITADLTMLQSDSANRDRQLGRQALETATFPAATFVLTAPIELGTLPGEGAVVQVTATGDLTIHGVSRPVQIPIQARLESGRIAVAGSLTVAFSDFGIERPRALVVLSVADTAVVELLVHFTRSG